MTTTSRTSRVVVAGIGSEYRLDDGVGPLVAALVEAQSGTALDVGPLSEPLDLLGHWNDVELVVVIDAVRSGAPAGTVHVVEISVDESDHVVNVESDALASVATSTHGIGFEGALRLARAIGQAPKRLVVVGVEGERFGVGEGLSSAVEAAVPEALRRVLSLIEEL